MKKILKDVMLTMFFIMLMILFSLNSGIVYGEEVTLNPDGYPIYDYGNVTSGVPTKRVTTRDNVGVQIPVEEWYYAIKNDTATAMTVTLDVTRCCE